MKKILAFTLFVLMGVVASFSQDINFHAKAGVGFANLTGDANGAPLFSYKVGVGMNIGLGGHWELHPDLFFVRKGMSNSAEVRSNDIGMKGDLTLNAYYLELPVMAHPPRTDGCRAIRRSLSCLRSRRQGQVNRHRQGGLG